MFDSREEIIANVKWNGEGQVDFSFRGGTGWCGVLRKDFWNADEDWESRLVPGTHIRLWTVQWSIVVGFECKVDHKWTAVWCAANDFKPKAERDAGAAAYQKFIEDEAVLLAERIDAGMEPKAALDAVSRDHTGNTMAWSVNLAVNRECKNKDLAEKFRRYWNKDNGVEGEKPGVVNPAVLQMRVDK